MFEVNLSDAKTKRIAAHLDPRRNPADMERLMKEVLLTGRGRQDLDRVISLAVDEIMTLSVDTAGSLPPGPDLLQLFVLSCRDLVVGECVSLPLRVICKACH